MDDNGARVPAAKLASPFLTTPQAADFVGLSDRTLERMRTEGQGPDYRKHHALAHGLTRRESRNRKSLCLK